MASMSSHNPSFSEFNTQRPDQEAVAPRASRNRTVATYAAVAFVGAAALGVGVVLGNSLSAPATTTVVAGEASAAVADPEAVLTAFYRDQPELSEINFGDLDALVTQYENTHSPNRWANNFVPEEFVAEWSKVRQEEPSEDAGRRLREQRELIGSYPVDLTRVAHASTFAPRVNPIVYQNDAAGVEKKGSRCVISFDTSQDAADWVDNLNVGNGPIYSVNEYTESGPSCPTSTCTGKRIVGQGYDGFRLAWNNLNTRVWARMQATCGGVTEYVFTGYSRGGAIATVAAAAMYVEGLLPASQIKQITFGSPLSLGTAMSDSVHNKYVQYRFVYKSDPVPAVPFKSWGVRHTGEMRCISCWWGGEGRDRPSWFNPFGIGSHGGYQGWNP
jgi:hypothetical protein